MLYAPQPSYDTTLARRSAASSLAEACAFRMRCQRLDQRTDEPLPRALAQVGYVAVPGGATPYLALRARSPRFDRRLVDNAVFETATLAQVPFTRGSTVLAPAHDAPWLLAAAHRAHETRTAPLRRQGDVDEPLRGRTSDAIVRLLEGGALTTDELRARLAEPLCVPLGELGRKLGFPSLFALALRELQLDGLVTRVQRERRLDRDAFEWALPAHALGPAADRAEALEALAGRYFRAHAPAPVAAFAHWAEATMGEARAAVTAAGLVSVDIEGQREPWWLAPEQLDDFLSFDAPSPARLAFVPFRDPSVSAAKDLLALLADEHRTLALSDWRGRLVAGGGGHLVHHHFLLHGGRVAGLWEFDAMAKAIRWVTFSPMPTRARRLADDMAQELAAWIAEDLSTACFYDGDKEASFPDLEATRARWSRN